MSPDRQAGDSRTTMQKIRHTIFGAPKHLQDRHIFHTMSLIPILAWVGLGADGLSSSAYGPEEAFKALGSHIYLALLLAVVTAMTVFIISYAYSRIIEHFPHGGGGYIVATHLLGEKAGVVSGSALPTTGWRSEPTWCSARRSCAIRLPRSSLVQRSSPASSPSGWRSFTTRCSTTRQPSPSSAVCSGTG